uniref:polyphosphate kinase 1 n=1 Tax=Lachnospira sp. TaxID=2049031 RepID=UPI00402837E0
MFWRLKAIKFPFKRKKDEQQTVIEVKSVETAKERIKAAIEPAQVKKSDVNVTAKKQASESVDVIEVSGNHPEKENNQSMENDGNDITKPETKETGKQRVDMEQYNKLDKNEIINETTDKIKQEEQVKQPMEANSIKSAEQNVVSAHKNLKEIEENYRKKGEKLPFFANRELSWLKFNERVIDEADDKSVPLCERLTFVSIFNSNLDEFYMVRVGSLYDQMILAKKSKQEFITGFDNKSMMTAEQQLDAVFAETRELLHKKDKIYARLMYEFDSQGVKLISFNDVEYSDAVYLENYFNKSILPILSPQVIGKKNPFPFLKNKEIYAVALLGSKNNDKIGLVPCSNGIFDRLIPIPSDSRKYMLVEELILHFLPKIFKKYSVKSKSLIRIIRNADIDMDEAFFDEDMDYRDTMEQLIKERRRLCPVKLEYSRVLDDKVISELCKELKLDKKQVFYSESPLEMSFISKIQDDLRGRRELFYERRVPQNSKQLDIKQPIMDQIAKKDVLLSYPYESMHPLIKLLNEAGSDDRVLSIKMTLYRVAKNSQIVEALIEAAENGKEVVVLVELRARFDEENNIEWSRRLEEAGCKIIYGIEHIKVHSKLCLITYKDGEDFKYITHVGTGNFNEKTAKLYTDLALITSDVNIARETADVFINLGLGDVVEHTEHLLVAPKCLQNKVLELIDDEIKKAQNGEEAYIGIKINSLTDKTIIEKLVEASMSGVKIDMVIRGISCMVAGIEGYTDNITITSIVGRFLEHSRIYIFGKGKTAKIYISSADFMTRNTIRRVEVATPVYDDGIKERILRMFNTMLSDNVKARIMANDGNYYKKDVVDGISRLNSQEYFYDEVVKKAQQN